MPREVVLVMQANRAGPPTPLWADGSASDENPGVRIQLRENAGEASVRLTRDCMFSRGRLPVVRVSFANPSLHLHAGFRGARQPESSDTDDGAICVAHQLVLGPRFGVLEG